MRSATRLAVVFGLVGLGIALLLFAGVFAQSPAARAQTGPTATPTRAAYPLPVTPSITPTPTATPKGNKPPTSTPTQKPTATPTIGFSPLLTGTPTASGPYTVYLPLIMSNQPLAACAPDTDGLGLAPFWPYQAFALSDRLTLRVNLCNGNLVVQYGAFNIPSRGLPLALSHTYNSGSGQWLHSLGAHLWVIDSSGSVSLQDAEGGARTFTHNADGSFTAPAGIFDRLVKNGDGTYSLTRPDQSVLAFDATGVLTQTRDRVGNAINLTYSSGLLAQAQAAGGQTLSFSYTDGALTAIADNAGHTVTLGYSGGWLTTLSDPLGAQYTLAYTATLLASLTDPRGVATTRGGACNRSRWRARRSRRSRT